MIGMVGALPILKIPGSGLHYVKKKKGRFNLLQESPAITTVGLAGTATSSAMPPASLGPVNSQVQPAGAQANAAPIPNNITVPTRSQSPMSGVSQLVLQYRHLRLLTGKVLRQ